MSLKFYLFCLIGCLVIMLTGSQLLFIYLLKQDVEAEIEIQAQDLSKRVIDVAFENIELRHIKTANKAKVEVITVESQPIKQAEHEAIILIETADATVAGHTPAMKKQVHQVMTDVRGLIKDEFKRQIKVLHKTGNNHNSGQQWVFESRQSSGKINELTNKIQWAIAISAMLALIVAYWLSAQFNRPLLALTNGFARLEQGDYQHLVKVQGTGELKNTIKQFNQMVHQLATLQALEKSAREFKHLAELGEVSKGLAHALRNPMHTIGLAIDKLQQNQLDNNEQKSLFEIIQTKILHINKTISALLSLTASSFRREEEIPLLAIVQDILLEVKTSEHLKTPITTDIAPELKIVGEESEIRSILHTLIINACEADKNKAGIAVSAEQDPSQQQVVITISDQGEGLSDTIADKLYEPHVSTKPEGAGMGLYVSKRLISLYYDGDIELKNNEFGGCTARAIFAKQDKT